ncbi:MAG: phosphatidylglycerophosphatase A [Phycisphaerales bacterium]|nr:phosphatidylglycerophosphatase A [Phycisphaerales bacterium]
MVNGTPSDQPVAASSAAPGAAAQRQPIAHLQQVAQQRPLAHRVLLLVGSLGPLGWMPASGTVTVGLVGVPLFWWMSGMGPLGWCAILLPLGLASVWIHQVGDRLLGEEDSGTLVWDEVFGYLVAVAALPWTWQIALTAFLVERTLDIAKVPPANVIERRCPGGWGVVGDDLVAGLYARLLLMAGIALVPEWLGLGGG